MALRITRSASDSSSSISSHTFSACSATACSPMRPSSLTAACTRSQHLTDRSVSRTISAVMWCTSYRAMVSAESCSRSATSSIMLISPWICSRSIGVMKVVWISRLTVCVTLSAARSALSTSWLYFSRMSGSA